MEKRPPITTQQATQTAVVVACGLAAFNAAFYFLSASYFRDHADAANIGSVRLAFAVLTLILAVATFAAVVAPRAMGHGIAALIGLSSIVAGFAAFQHGMTSVMGTTLLIIGVLVPLLVWQSFQHSRAAWAFLIAIMAVFGTVAFFGAPKVRGLLGIGLWTALIVPGLQFVTVVALTMVRREYREGAADSRRVLPTQAAAKAP